MRSVFLAFLITAAQRQFACFSFVRISFSIAFRIAPGCTLLLSLSSTLDVLTVQYSVSVIVDEIVREKKRVRTLLSGSVRAASAYDKNKLGSV